MTNQRETSPHELHTPSSTQNGLPAWNAPLHTRRFRQLVQGMLECYFRHGVLDDIPEEDIPLIARLSVLHDIGKLQIPESIVNKPGRLSPEENIMMKQHPLLGASLVERLFQDKPKTSEYTYLYEICRHHHERWDGSGYPDGLRGDEIPRYVQIISMADALDALLARRSYRPSLDLWDAITLIYRGGCGEFASQLQAIFDHEAEGIALAVYFPSFLRERQRLEQENPPIQLKVPQEEA